MKSTQYLWIFYIILGSGPWYSNAPLITGKQQLHSHFHKPECIHALESLALVGAGGLIDWRFGLLLHTDEIYY